MKVDFLRQLKDINGEPLVKKLIGNAYSAVVVGQAWATLEGK